MGVSSRSCINRSEAQVGELLLYSNNKRACSVFPQVCCTQTINVPDQCFLRYVIVFRQYVPVHCFLRYVTVLRQ